jgi:hypothetical protein
VYAPITVGGLGGAPPPDSRNTTDAPYEQSWDVPDHVAVELVALAAEVMSPATPIASRPPDAGPAWNATAVYEFVQDETPVKLTDECIALATART